MSPAKASPTAEESTRESAPMADLVRSTPGPRCSMLKLPFDVETTFSPVLVLATTCRQALPAHRLGTVQVNDDWSAARLVAIDMLNVAPASVESRMSKLRTLSLPVASQEMPTCWPAW